MKMVYINLTIYIVTLYVNGQNISVQDKHYYSKNKQVNK